MTLHPAHEPPEGDALFIDGQFRVVRALGHGGMARVYLCSYLAGCLVAVKCLGKGVPQGVSLAEMHDRFQRESSILLSLRHPAIVAAYTHGYDSSSELRYLVMEYVRGATLIEVRRGLNRALTAPEAAELLLPIADALAYCHSRKVFHRDVTPRNILVTRDRASTNAKLVDFGAGWQADHQDLTGPVVFGSFDFQPLERMSPEHRGRVDDAHQAAIDIYGLAAVAYFLTGGEGPQGQLLSMADKLGTQPLQAGPDARWCRLLAHALRHDPSTRLPNMTLFRDELKSWVDSNEMMVTEPYIRPYWARNGFDTVDDPTRETPRNTEPRDAEGHSDPNTLPLTRSPIARPAGPSSLVHQRPLFIVTNPLRVQQPDERRKAWLVLLALVGAIGAVTSGVFALGVVVATRALVTAVIATESPDLPVATASPEVLVPTRTEIDDPAAAAVAGLRTRLSGLGVQLRANPAGVVTVGDGRIHVPEALLELEMNYEGRTLGGKNPGYPWVALSPPHEVQLASYEIAERPLTWAAWEALGGRRPVGGPCAGASPVDPVGCVNLADVAEVFNAASARAGLDPAMDPVTGAWNGVANGLRLPTEAEWEQAALAGGLTGAREWVINAEPLPDLPGPGAGSLRGHEVVRDVRAGPKQRGFQRPDARSPQVGVRLAWSPSSGPTRP